jgi:hypothetical protein
MQLFRGALCTWFALLLACRADIQADTALANETSTATDDPTSASSDTTGSPTSVLAACELAAPCEAVSVYCDYDGCAGPNAMADDATVCAWTQLRDGAAFRLHIAESYTLEPSRDIATPGDPARTVLLDNFYPTHYQRRCTLADPAFFQACIDDPADKDPCFQTDAWFLACEDVPSLVCPVRRRVDPEQPDCHRRFPRWRTRTTTPRPSARW